MNNKIFKILIVLVLMFFVSCKEEIKHENNKETSDSTLKDSVLIESTSNLSNEFIDKKFVQIIKQDEKFKLSCANKSNKVILNEKSLHIEIVEPIDYSIDKIIKENDGFKIYLKGEEFYYDVTIVDKNIGITSWKNCNLTDNKLDLDYSFFAIDELNLTKANLEKENCDENSEISSWTGRYHLEVSSTHGDGKEVLDKYDIIIKDIKNIEFISENYRFLISGEFLNKNAIEGDISKVLINKKNATTSFSPFLKLTRDGDTFFVTCPLITQGAGFSSTPFEMEKK